MFDDKLLLTPDALWVAIVCLCLMALDIVSGFSAAWVKGELSSTKMREGMVHKGMIIVLMCAGWIVNYAFPIYLPACGYIMVMEAVSITENVIEANPSMKDTPLARLFLDLGKKNEKEEE